MDSRGIAIKHLYISNQRRPHFKRRLYLQGEERDLDEDLERAASRRRGHFRAGLLARKSGSLASRLKQDRDQDQIDSGAENDLEDDSDDQELAFVERLSEPPRLEDEMIFELHQVDEIPQSSVCLSSPVSSSSLTNSSLASPSTITSSSSSSSSSSSGSSSSSSSSSSGCFGGQLLGRGPNLDLAAAAAAATRNEPQAGATGLASGPISAQSDSCKPISNSHSSSSCTNGLSTKHTAKEEMIQMQQQQQQQPTVAVDSSLSSKNNNNNNSGEDDDEKLQQIHKLSQLQLQQQQHQQQLRFRTNNPVKFGRSSLGLNHSGGGGGGRFNWGSDWSGRPKGREGKQTSGPQKTTNIDDDDDDDSQRTDNGAQEAPQASQPAGRRRKRPESDESAHLTRTIFSCMWPGCTNNYDRLTDVERHVRLHLGRKQCDSIGDEDFYYEETEVDEPTYLAVFGVIRLRGRAANSSLAPTTIMTTTTAGPESATTTTTTTMAANIGAPPARSTDEPRMSPLGQSFDSSSPVCSGDSSSSSPSSSLSSTSSSRGDQSSSSSVASCSSGGHQASQLYANSIDWSHFLADQRGQQVASRQLGSPTLAAQAKHSWLPNQRQQLQLLYYASIEANQHLAEPPARKQQRGDGKQQQQSHNKRTHLNDDSPPSLLDACFLLSPPSSEPETPLAAPASAAAPATAAPGAPFRQRQQRQRVARNYKLMAKAGPGSPPASPLPAAASSSASSSSSSSSQPSLATCSVPAAGKPRTGAKRGRKPKALKLQQTSQSGQHAAPANDCKPATTTQASVVTSGQQGPSNQTSQQFFHHQSTSSSNRAANSSSSSSGSNSSTSDHQYSINVSKLGNDSNLKAYNNGHQLQRGSFADGPLLIGGNDRNGGGAPAAAIAAGAPLRRGRGDHRKCRKVYGMERRDLWCTQCKWKKACSRFCDQ